MRIRVKHGIAGSTGISSFFFGSLGNAVKLFNFVGTNIADVPLMTCSLYLGSFNLPETLCFLLSTFGQR